MAPRKNSHWLIASAAATVVLLLVLSSKGTGTQYVVESAGSPKVPAKRQEKMLLSDPRSNQDNADVKMLPAWGYNPARNAARWKAIGGSIAADVPSRGAKFTLADYGADQGFFSVSAAVSFPESTVMPVEAGGTGGVLWAKDVDAIEIMKGKIREHKASNIVLCKTTFTGESFRKFADAHLVLDYQFLLSVIHWFEMSNKDEWEVAIVNIVRAARTTIIEFPFISPDEHNGLMKNQVGYARWKTWLAGRGNWTDAVYAAFENPTANPQKLRINMVELASLPWMENSRRLIHRIDVVEGLEPLNFACEQRKQLLACDNAVIQGFDCPAEGH
jgi:hypothetical protein